MLADARFAIIANIRGAWRGYGARASQAIGLAKVLDELRGAFRIEERRTQRRSDGTVTIAGVRYELPSRYRTLERLSVRYATWDLAAVHLVDDKSGAVLAPLDPLDRTRNGTQSRRLLAEVVPLAGIAAPPTRPPSWRRCCASSSPRTTPRGSRRRTCPRT